MIRFIKNVIGAARSYERMTEFVNRAKPCAPLKSFEPFRLEPIRFFRPIPIVADSEEAVPQFETEGAAGMDLRAAHKELVRPGERVLIGTGIKVALPKGTAMFILPRSSFPLKFGVTVANSPGLIDEDYRGEVKVCLINHSRSTFTVTPGMKLAQAMVVPYYKVKWQVVESLDETERGEGGFGSTGVQVTPA